MMKCLRVLFSLLGGFISDAQNVTAIIVSAVLADTVGQLHFLATGAFHNAGCTDLPVRPTAMLSRLRNFSFRKGHGSHLSFILAQSQCRKRIDGLLLDPA